MLNIKQTVRSLCYTGLILSVVAVITHLYFGIRRHIPSFGPKITTAPYLTLQGFQNRISSVEFSHDGVLLAIGDSATKINLWDLKNGKSHRFLEKSDAEGGVVFSADGRLVVSGWKRIWNAKTGKLLRSFHEVHGQYVVIRSQRYDPNNGQMVSVMSKVPVGITALVVTTDGRYLATSSNDRTIKVWDTQKGKLRWRLRGHTDSVESIAFSPDGTLLASGSVDKTIKLWDVKRGILKRTLKGHSDTLQALSFLSDGKILASAGQSGELFIWDVVTGRLKQKHQTGNIIPEARFSADGRRLATSITQYGIGSRVWGDVWIHDSLTGKVLYKLETSAPDSFSLSPNGKMLAVGGIEYSQKYKKGFRIIAQIWRIP